MNLTRSFAAMAVASSLVLAGCGDKDKDDDSSKAGDPGSGSTETTEVSTPDVEPGDSVDVADFVDEIQAGVESMTTAHMTMQMTGGQAASMGVEAEGDVDYSSTPPMMAMTMTASGMNMEIRFVDGLFYMNLGEMGGGKFYTATAEDLSAGAGMDIAEMMDPAASFEAIEQGMQEVVFVGEDEIDGEDADHYELTLDTTKVDLFDQVPNVPKTITYDYWVDEQGRMVQTEVEVMGMTTLMTLGDFGEDVDIEKPATSEIAGDFSELTGSGL